MYLVKLVAGLCLAQVTNASASASDVQGGHANTIVLTDQVQSGLRGRNPGDSADGSGTGDGTGLGSAVSISSGAGTFKSSGAVVIRSGDAGTSGVSGTMTFQTGTTEEKPCVWEKVEMCAGSPRPMMPNANVPSDHLFRHEALEFTNRADTFTVAPYFGPTTSYKVRGPGSVQTMKVGEYITDTIDFIAFKGLKTLPNHNKAAKMVACGTSVSELPITANPANGFNLVTWNVLESKLQDDGFVTEMRIGEGCAKDKADAEEMMAKYKEGFSADSEWKKSAEAMMLAADNNKALIKAASSAAMGRAERDMNGPRPTKQKLENLAAEALDVNAKTFYDKEEDCEDGVGCPDDPVSAFAKYKMAFEEFSRTYHHKCLAEVAPGEDRYEMVVKIAKEKLSASVITFQEFDKLLPPILEKAGFMGASGKSMPKIKLDTAIFWDKNVWTGNGNEGCVLQEGGKKCKCMWAGLEQTDSPAAGEKKKTLLVASLHLTSGKKKKDIKERKKELEAFAPALAEIAQKYDAFVIGADTNHDTGAELLHQWVGRELMKWTEGE